MLNQLWFTLRCPQKIRRLMSLKVTQDLLLGKSSLCHVLPLIFSSWKADTSICQHWQFSALRVCVVVVCVCASVQSTSGIVLEKTAILFFETRRAEPVLADTAHLWPGFPKWVIQRDQYTRSLYIVCFFVAETISLMSCVTREVSRLNWLP